MKSKLTDKVINAEIHIPGYTLFRQDWKARTGRGVCTYVKDRIAAKVKLAFSNDQVKVLIITMKPTNIINVNMYRPPNTTEEAFSEALAMVQETIDKVRSEEPRMQLVVKTGEYNFPDIPRWSYQLNAPEDDVVKT